MAKAEFIRARVDEDLKTSVESLFSRLGLTMTEAITLFLTQCEMRQGLPFEVKIPNAETQKALDDAHTGVNMTSYSTPEEIVIPFAVVAASERKMPRPGCMKGKIWIADDFDAPLDDFKELVI